MTEESKNDHLNNSLEQEWILSSLESGQLSEAKKQHFPRRTLRRSQMLVLWSLRIYLLFMMAVVIYQIWSGAGN
ncbi:MAG TPA: hypothetical protein VG649_24925 [Candidatus Angelobacter sp.]|nr:hypothetical protein [Candidatus Angelobacter sp.]